MMKELTIEAKKQNLTEVLAFVDGVMEEEGCSLKAQMKVDVAAEEIFVNIASYAYGDGVGYALIRAGRTDRNLFEITFIDEGVPYDPTSKEDPDVSLSAEERPIGGLGIFLAFKVMDEVKYEYAEGRNQLTLRKIC